MNENEQQNQVTLLHQKWGTFYSGVLYSSCAMEQPPMVLVPPLPLFVAVHLSLYVIKAIRHNIYEPMRDHNDSVPKGSVIVRDLILNKQKINVSGAFARFIQTTNKASPYGFLNNGQHFWSMKRIH